MKSEPEIRQFRAFAAIVDMGGFTRAAAMLGVSQSTVSEAIHALERALGTDVFVKGKRRPTLTPAGERLLPGARRVLSAMDEAVRDVAEAEAGARATVALGTSESISAYVLPGVLAEVRREWPGTRYVVTTDACASIRVAVRERRLDLGLILGMPNGVGEEESACLAEGRLVLFARPEHPLASRPAEIDGLAGTTLHLSDAAGDFWVLIRSYFEQAGFAATRVQSAGSVEGVKRGVQADPGSIGLLPAYAVADEIARGTFIEVRPKVPLPPIRLTAIWRKDTVLPPRAGAIAERLRAMGLSPVSTPA